MTRSLILVPLLAVLSGCGGDDAARTAATPAAPDVAVVDPTPSPTASPTPSPTSSLEPSTPAVAAVGSTIPASGNPFAGFDFKGGTAYPARARVRIGDVNVPVGATEVHVPITLDRPTPNTIIARAMTRNGSGGKNGIQGTHYSKVDTFVIFRPGDPLEQTVRIPLRNMDAGRQLELIFPTGVSGGGNADGSGRITAVGGAAATVAKTSGFRAPRRFAPTGQLTYRLNPATVKWADAGRADTWTTKLPHGRTQPGNNESGLYLDGALHHPPMAPFSIEQGELVIRSQQLVTPIRHEGKDWYHGAAILTGQKMPTTQVKYGQYEWEAVMPNRRGGWPALWLLPTSGWPPEIDVYEGFGYSSGWNFGRDYSANIHGGARNARTFTASTQFDASAAYGISGFDTSYHKFSVDIATDYITWFIDGKEVYQTLNPFHGTTWFPLMNVAVKHSGDYVGGTAEMRVRSFAVWNAAS